MEYEYNEGKRGHAGIALILSILGLLVIIFVGLFFGMIGVVPGTIMAALGIFLGIMSMRVAHGKGKGGLIIGIIALLFSLLIGGMTSFLGEFLHSQELKEHVPTLAAYADQSWRGIGGLLMKMSSDGVDFDQLSKEIDAYSKEAGAGATQTAQTVITEATKS